MLKCNSSHAHVAAHCAPLACVQHSFKVLQIRRTTAKRTDALAASSSSSSRGRTSTSAAEAPGAPLTSSQSSCHSTGVLFRQGPRARPSRVVCAAKGSGKSAQGDDAAAPLFDKQRRKGCCYGCGARLQVEVPLGPGYVKPEKFEVKKRHKQLDKVLCERCTELCNGAMIPAVEDFTQKLQAQALREAQEASDQALELLGKALISPEQLRAQLMEVREKKAVVVMLVDLTDVSGTLMGKVRDMVGNNPIVLVGTKVDLLPAGVVMKDVVQWLEDAATSRRLNVMSAYLISSHTGQGISAVTAKICRERKGRDVYVIGAANVGKSAFVRAMLREMAQMDSVNFDMAALGNGRYLPVESPMPGTTLGIIPLQAFATGGTLYDTPGVHLHHRVPHILAPHELKLLHPRKRLHATVPPSPRAVIRQQHREDEAEAGEQPDAPMDLAPSQPVSATYLWSDLVRVDVLGAPPSTRLAFYGPNTMQVQAVPLMKAPSTQVEPAAASGATGDDPSSSSSSSSSNSSNSNGSGTSASASASSGEGGDSSTSSGSSSAGGSGGVHVLRCAASVQARGGLVPHELHVKVDGGRDSQADVAVSGLPGWITVWSPGAKRDVRLRVWVPRGVEVFLRPPMPCPPPASPQDQALQEGLRLTPEQLGRLMADYQGFLGSRRHQKGPRRGKEEASDSEPFPEDDDYGGDEGDISVTDGDDPEQIVLSARVEDIWKMSRRAGGTRWEEDEEGEAEAEGEAARGRAEEEQPADSRSNAGGVDAGPGGGRRSSSRRVAPERGHKQHQWTTGGTGSEHQPEARQRSQSVRQQRPGLGAARRRRDQGPGGRERS